MCAFPLRWQSFHPLMHITLGARVAARVMLVTLLLASPHVVASIVSSPGEPSAAASAWLPDRSDDVASVKLGSDGAATYSVPMGAVALEYDSRRKRRPWRLTGGGAIERSTRWGPPKGSPADIFVLDGERLVCGQSCDEVGKDVVRTYHVADQTYQRIRFHHPDTNISYWEVTDRATGATSYYGRNEIYSENEIANGRGSRILWGHEDAPGDRQRNPRAWALERVVDAGGHHETRYYYERGDASDIQSRHADYAAWDTPYRLIRVIAGKRDAHAVLTEISYTEARPRASQRDGAGLLARTQVPTTVRVVGSVKELAADHWLLETYTIDWNERQQEGEPNWAGRHLVRRVERSPSNTEFSFAYTEPQRQVQIEAVDTVSLDGAIREYRDYNGDGLIDRFRGGLSSEDEYELDFGVWNEGRGYEFESGLAWTDAMKTFCADLQGEFVDGDVQARAMDIDGDGRVDCVYRDPEWNLRSDENRALKFRIGSRLGNCLDDLSGEGSLGAKVRMGDCHDGEAQLWKIDEVRSPMQAIRIRSSLNPDHCVVPAMDDGGVALGDRIILEQCPYGAGGNSAARSIWRVGDDGTLRNDRDPSLALDVRSRSASSGAEVILWSHDGGLAQQWDIVATSDVMYWVSDLPSLIEEGAEEGDFERKRRPVDFVHENGQVTAGPLAGLVRMRAEAENLIDLGSGKTTRDGWLNEWADVNGDGRLDIVKMVRYGREVVHEFWINRGGGRFQRDVKTLQIDESLHPEYLDTIVRSTGDAVRSVRLNGIYRDVNGDGLTDFLVQEDGNLHVYYNVLRHNASNRLGYVEIPLPFGEEQLLIGSRFRNDEGRAEYYDLRDVNDDGLMDMLYAQYEGGSAPMTLQVAYNSGAEFSRPVTWDAVPSGLAGDIAGSLEGAGSERLGLPGLDDHDGDGLLGMVEKRSKFLSRQPGARESAPVVGGLLARVEEPAGAAYGYNYASRRHFEVPGERHPDPGWVVTALTVEDGLGGVDRTSYTYEGGRYDHALGLDLGFSAVSETTLDGIVTETHYHQGGVQAGLAWKIVRRAPDGAIFDYIRREYEDYATWPDHYGRDVRQRDRRAPADISEVSEQVSAVHLSGLQHYRVDGATSVDAGVHPEGKKGLLFQQSWEYNRFGEPSDVVRSNPGKTTELRVEYVAERDSEQWATLPYVVQWSENDSRIRMEEFRYDDELHPTQWTVRRVLGPDGAMADETRRQFDNGNLVRLERLNGLVTEYEYDPIYQTLPARVTRKPGDGVPQTTEFLYDLRGNVKKKTVPSGATTEFERDGAGRVVRVSDRVAPVVDLQYRSHVPGDEGQAALPAGVRIEGKPGDGGETVKQRRYFDGFGRVVQISARIGGGWSHRYRWYALGGRIEAVQEDDTIHSSGDYARPLQPEAGARLRYRGLDGEFGRVTLGGIYRVPASWRLMNSRLDSDGRLVTDVRDELPDLRHAGLPPTKPGTIRSLLPGLVQGVVPDSDGDVPVQSLPGDSWLESAISDAATPRHRRVVDPVQRTVVEHRVDGATGELTEFRTITREFDSDPPNPVGATVMTETDASGATTRVVTDWLGRPVEIARPEHGTRYFEHDFQSGTIIETTPVGSVETRFDPLGRRVWQATSDGAISRWFYDGDLDGDGVVDPQRDTSVGRLTGAASLQRKGGQLVLAEGGSVVYEHDDRGKTMVETRTLGERQWRTEYRYDRLGRLVGLKFPGDERFTDYEYDAGGAVARIHDGQADETVLRSISRDALGRIQDITYGNGARALYRWYGQAEAGDGAWPGALASAELSDFGGRDAEFRYRYDERGRVARIEDGSTDQRFGRAYEWDRLDRLTGVEPLSENSPLPSESYRYGVHGGLASQNGLPYYGGARPTVAMGHRLAYDAAGNMIQRDDQRYEYDVLGRLRRAYSDLGVALPTPELHWTFEGVEEAQAAGDPPRVLDIGAGGHHGRPGPNGDPVPGRDGMAMSFRNGGSVSTEEDFSDYPVDALTFSFWARRDDAIDCGRGGQWRWMLAQEWGGEQSERGVPAAGSKTGGPFHVIAEDDDTRGIVFTVVPEGWDGDYGSMYRLWSETGRIEADRWHHYAGSYDAASGEMVLYIDGERVNSEFFEARPIIGDSGGVLSVGAAAIDGCAKGGAFPGAVDDVRIFDEVLGAEQIRALYSGTSLIGAWDFTEVGATSVSDFSASGYEAQLVGGAVIEEAEDGSRGVSFPQSEGAVEVAGFSAAQPREALTFSFWARRDERLDCGGGAQWRWMLAQEWGDTLPADRSMSGGPFHVIAEEGDRGIAFTVLPEDWDGNYDSAYRLWSETGRIPAGEWHHYAGTYDADADEMRLYLDGELVASRPQEDLRPIRRGTGPLTLGARLQTGCVTGGPFPGTIDRVRLYDRALSGVEIEGLAAQRLAGRHNGERDLAALPPLEDTLKFDQPAQGQQGDADPDVVDEEGRAEFFEEDAVLPGQVGAWDFTDVGAHRVLDLGEAGHAATLSGGAVIEPAADGALGVSFPQRRGYVELVEAGEVKLDAAVAFSFWARADETLDCSGGNEWYWLLEQRAGPGSSSENSSSWGPFNVIADQDGTVTFTVAPAGWGREFGNLHRVKSHEGALADGDWHHYAGTYDGSSGRMRLYVDGELAYEEETSGGVLAEDAEFHGGRGSLMLGSSGREGCGTASPFPGRIDRLRVYREELSAQEIQTHAAQQPVVATTDTPDDNEQGEEPSEPAGAWDFTEVGAVRVPDESGNGHEALLVGDAAIHAAEEHGLAGVAFPGSRGAVELGTASALQPRNAMSLGFWARADEELDCDYARNWRQLLVKHNTEASGHGPISVRALEGEKGFRIRIKPQGWQTLDDIHELDANSGSIRPGEWHHYAATYNAENGWLRLYHDGREVASEQTSGGAIETDTGLLMLGARNVDGCASGASFPGRIDRVRFYDRVLSDGEIRSLYEPWSDVVEAQESAVRDAIDNLSDAVRDGSGKVSDVIDRSIDRSIERFRDILEKVNKWISG